LLLWVYSGAGEFLMQKYQNKCIIIIGLMIVFAGLIVWVQYKHPGQTAHADISKIPLNIAG
jgi:hypothetical protein